jgi:hypothetical protein
MQQVQQGGKWQGTVRDLLKANSTKPRWPGGAVVMR